MARVCVRMVGVDSVSADELSVLVSERLPMSVSQLESTMQLKPICRTRVQNEECRKDRYPGPVHSRKFRNGSLAQHTLKKRCSSVPKSKDKTTVNSAAWERTTRLLANWRLTNCRFEKNTQYSAIACITWRHASSASRPAKSKISCSCNL